MYGCKYCGKEVATIIRVHAIGDEVGQHHPIFEDYFLKTEILGHLLELYDADQLFKLLRDRTETVLHLPAQGLNLLIIGNIGQILVESYFFRGNLYVIIRNIGLQIGLYLGIHHWRGAHRIGEGHILSFAYLLFTQLRHRFVEDTHIGIKSHLGNKSALFRTQKVACSAYIEILHRNIESAPQIRKGLDRPDSSSGIIRNGGNGRYQQITVGFDWSDLPSPELMEIAQTEALRLIDDHRVGIGNIDAFSMMVVASSISYLPL